MRIFLVLLIILACTSCSHREKSIDVKKFLASLPEDERFLLDKFFRSMIQQDVIGYTLLGAKPMSFYSYLKPKVDVYRPYSDPVDLMDTFIEGFDEDCAIFHKGWEVWKKYQHHFCGSNIFFDIVEEDEELHFVNVVVINKRLMLPLLEQYSCKFRELDPSLKSKKSLLEAILHNQDFKKKMHSHNEILGICLGYGARNAKLFQKMSELFFAMGWMSHAPEKYSPTSLKCLEEDWKALKQSFKGGIRDHRSRDLLFHLGIGFRADISDSETPVLIGHYTKYHKKLTLAYDGADFLEKTLELINLADKT